MDLARRASLAIASPGKRAARAPRSRVSVSYLSLIENGYRVPDEPVAIAIAQALGDDVALYRAWVRARKRADLESALAAAETLNRLLREPPMDTSAGGSSPDPAKSGASLSSTRLRVPLIHAGADPGESVRPRCSITQWLRFDPDLLTAALRRRISRPFAYPLSPSVVRRVPDLLPSEGRALVLRDFLPLRPDHVYAVRSGVDVILTRALWNGRQLLLLPAPGAHDFEVLDIEREEDLAARILGLALAARFEPEVNPR